jgi:hypothetical protein
MNELQKIFILPDTRQDIKNYIAGIKENILSGEQDPLKVLKSLKVFELIIEELKNDSEIKGMIQNEADKYPSKTIDFEGCKITKSERSSYDYSQCNDSELLYLEKSLEITKDAIKKRQDFLKKVPDGFVNMESGEIINPAIKTVKEIISVTL